MDLTASTDRRDFRLAACATPIAAPGITDFQTILSPTNVAFLNPPMTIGTVLVEAPRRSIRQGEYFMARFLAHSGWKRASFLALTTEEAPAMRDIVTLRMLAEPQEAPQRMHPRERIGLKLTSRVRSGSSLAEAPVQVTVVDASRGGVCVETPAQLLVGDVLYLEGPQEPDRGADFEVLRADPALRNRYGGRFLEQEAGNALFEQLVEAARAERAARRQRPEHDAATRPAAADGDQASRGMRHREHE